MCGIAFLLTIRKCQTRGFDQFVPLFKGFQDQPIHAAAQGFDRGFNRPETRHHEGGYIGLMLFSKGDYAKAIHFGHTDIDEEQINAFAAQIVHRLLGISKC